MRDFTNNCPILTPVPRCARALASRLSSGIGAGAAVDSALSRRMSIVSSFNERKRTFRVDRSRKRKSPSDRKRICDIRAIFLALPSTDRGATLLTAHRLRRSDTGSLCNGRSRTSTYAEVSSLGPTPEALARGPRSMDVSFPSLPDRYELSTKQKPRAG